MMVERQTIPHLNALVDGSKILGEQLCSFLRGCHATSSLKSVFFTRKVAWLSLIELHGCSWDVLEPTSRPLKWGIICFSSISGSLSYSLFTKYSNPLVWCFRSVHSGCLALELCLYCFLLLWITLVQCFSSRMYFRHYRISILATKSWKNWLKGRKSKFHNLCTFKQFEKSRVF